MINTGKADNAIVARGLLAQIKCFTFIPCLVILEKVFSVSSKLSNVLQSESLDIASACTYVESTIDTLRGFRTEREWNLLLSKAKELATQNTIPVVAETSRRVSRTPSSLQNSVITASSIGTGSSETDSEYCTQLYYAILDALDSELHRRFSSLNLSIFKSIDTLSPQSNKFLDFNTLLPFVQHYFANLDINDIEIELVSASNYIKQV